VGAGSYSAVHARATIEQIRAVLDMLKLSLRQLTVEQATGGASLAAKSSIAYLQAAEKQFRGITDAASPRLNLVAIHDAAVSGAEASVLRRLGVSGEPGSTIPAHVAKQGILNRYGLAVVEKFEKRLQLMQLTGQSWAEARAEIIKASPFLGGKEPGEATMWAERIVRTECAAAMNKSNAQAIAASNEQLGDVVQILAATFDDRTSWDSYQVHGQIRRVGEAFVSAFGSYAHPPNRPNDREIVVPHRLSWPLPPELAWRDDGEVIDAWTRQGRNGSPPARPQPMTTVPLEEFGKAQPLPPPQDG